MFLLAPSGAGGLGAAGGQIGVMSLSQDHWGQVAFDANPSRSFLCGQEARANRQGVRTPAGSLQSGNFLLLCFDFLHPGN